MSISRKEFLKLTGLGLGAAAALGMPERAVAEGEVEAGKQVSMLYDSTRCIGCRACQTACREWNKTTVEKGPSGRYDMPLELSADTWTLIQLYQGENEHAFVKQQCMHCLHPACASACPVAALQKRDDGPVVYDPKRCIGCRYCMVACPFGVPRFEWDEVIPVIAKCTFCYDRLDAGQGPSCAEACPAGALVWGTRDEMLAEAKRRLEEHPDRYRDHVYGEHEAGGTSVLYLSQVDFKHLGLPELEDEPLPELSESIGTVVLPSLIIGGPIFLAAVRYLSNRRGE
jgi:formate dehydrogenase iron-sulfur subunit